MKIRPLSQNFSALGLGWMLLGALSAWRSRLVLTADSFIGLGPLFLPDPALGGNDLSTSLEAPGWTVQWIGRNNPAFVPPLGQQAPVPLLRKKFTLSNSVAKATLRICGGGSEIRYSTPPPTQYKETALYATFDVSDFLHPGANVIGVTLGRGYFAATASDAFNLGFAPWRNEPRLLLQLDITYRTAKPSKSSLMARGKWRMVRSWIR